MPTIRKATLNDFDAVYPLFSRFNEPRPSKEEFQQLFIPRWGSDETHVGFILEENGQAVGYLGTLFSVREINGRREKFCNLCTWIVKEEYRSEGLPLLFQVLKMKDVTVTNFTGNRVASILTKFDFKALDKMLKILLPIPTSGDGCELIFDTSRIAPFLDTHDRRILEDHREFKHPFVLLKAKDGVSLICFNKVKRKRLPVLEVHYLSERNVFLKHIRHVLLSLCMRTGALGLMVGEHFLGGESIPFLMTIPQRQLRLFRSKTVSMEEMDTMYSELQVLNL
ncbi:MAG: GNAT family N-acetyltransferase [Anaerolineae bacterium]|nr:GNAT family N-acetyltransferase [Anaerolineae bacterium]MCI0609314.1 GNAT family N-acetyltransferase [Anaerolineae bacterium]